MYSNHFQAILIRVDGHSKIYSIYFRETVKYNFPLEYSYKDMTLYVQKKIVL
jgi:hypothetical protein